MEKPLSAWCTLGGLLGASCFRDINTQQVWVRVTQSWWLLWTKTLRVFLCNRGGVGRGKGLPWWLSGKESTCNARDIGDVGSILGLGRSPGVGNVNALQYSCLENPKDRGAWWATVHGSQRVGHEWSDLTCVPGEGHTRTQRSIEKDVSWCFLCPVLTL